MDWGEIFALAYLSYLAGVVLGFNFSIRAYYKNEDLAQKILTATLFGVVCSPLMLLSALIIVLEVLLVTIYAILSAVIYVMSYVPGVLWFTRFKERREIWDIALGNYFNRVRNDVRWLFTPKYEPSS